MPVGLLILCFFALVIYAIYVIKLADEDEKKQPGYNDHTGTRGKNERFPNG